MNRLRELVAKQSFLASLLTAENANTRRYAAFRLAYISGEILKALREMRAEQT